jgi:hypothetical protein
MKIKFHDILPGIAQSRPADRCASKNVSQVLSLLAEGMDGSAIERVIGKREGTIRSWLTRAGRHAEKLHEQFFQELTFRHIQLDELWAQVRQSLQEVWLWVATMPARSPHRLGS